MGLRKYTYYLASIFELILNVRPLSTVFGVFLRAVQPGEKVIRLRKQGVSFKIRGAMDIWSVKETFLDRFYDRFGTPLGAGWTIVDIGGGIGDFTTYAARAHASNTVYAFEPTPESYGLLQENLKRNQALNAHGYAQAIWSEEGTLYIDTSVGEPGQFISHAGGISTSNKNASIAVASISLAQALQSLGINRCDLLKMDCEGAEYAILFTSPPETLEKIRRIVMEYHDDVTQYTHADLARFLEERGFTVQTTPNFVHKTLGYLYASRP
jgi:FkbM family methyltransferase